jgi:oligopeptide/dipeptide ABC transporter ATP-binding protein
VVEETPANELRARAAHPYTAGLLAARPPLDGARGRLPAIPGRPLSAFEAPAGCAFSTRCPRAEDRCHQEAPRPRAVGAGAAACHFAEDVKRSTTLAEALGE